jgi:hypothetical protein
MMEYKGYVTGPIDFEPELHRKAVLRTAAHGVSLSRWISWQIESAL